MSILVGLCGMLRLLRVDTLRRVHNVDFHETAYTLIIAKLRPCYPDKSASVITLT